MKKKIVILGSTGSIGSKTVDILKKNKKNYQVVLLTTNNNVKKVLRQAKDLKCKKVIINNKKKIIDYKNLFFKNNIKVYFSHNNLNKVIKNRIYYTMSSISGLSGLNPTLQAIKFSQNIGIANKESIVCAWNLI